MKQVGYIILCLFFVFTGGVCGWEVAVSTLDEAEPYIVEVQTDYEQLSGWQTLTMAIAMTESNFDSLAVSKAGAVGLMQIRSIYVDDVNRIMGCEEYSLSDAFSPEKSLEMWDCVQYHYNPEQDIIKAIHLHNPSAGQWYENRVLANYRYIVRMEDARELVYKNIN